MSIQGQSKWQRATARAAEHAAKRRRKLGLPDPIALAAAPAAPTTAPIKRCEHCGQTMPDYLVDRPRSTDRVYKTEGFVYVVRNDRTGNVKIGFSSNVADRLSTIQTSCDSPITLLASEPGGISYEKWLHRLYRPYRITGEWFAPHGELLAMISSLASGARLPRPEE